MQTIVYLDHNFLSNMSKARFDLMKDQRNAEVWNAIFQELKNAVIANKIVCPLSRFHSTEAMFDTRLEIPIKATINELALGLEFHTWRTIMEYQMEDAARVFLGQKKTNNDWTSIFKSNPAQTAEKRLTQMVPDDTHQDIHIPMPQEIVETNRNEKNEFLSIGQNLIEQYCEKPLEWENLVLESKISTLDGYLGNIARQRINSQIASDSLLDQMSGYDNYSKLSSLYDRLKGIGLELDNHKMMLDFMNSKELLDSPFIDIFSSLWAIIARCKQTHGRKQKSSDYFDVPILSIALPACDIIATDSFVKEIVTKLLHFDDKYHTTLFSANQDDISIFITCIRDC